MNLKNIKKMTKLNNQCLNKKKYKAKNQMKAKKRLNNQLILLKNKLKKNLHKSKKLTKKNNLTLLLNKRENQVKEVIR
jgi:hypothetical protein